MTGVARAVDFVCVDCGRMITRLCGPADNHGNLCAMCITVPAWFTYPELREILDPEHSGEWFKPDEDTGGIRAKSD